MPLRKVRKVRKGYEREKGGGFPHFPHFPHLNKYHKSVRPLSQSHSTGEGTMISKIKKARVKKDQAGTSEGTLKHVGSEGTLKHVGGSPSDDWNNRIVHDTWQALWRVHSDAETLNVQ